MEDLLMASTAYAVLFGVVYAANKSWELGYLLNRMPQNPTAGETARGIRNECGLFGKVFASYYEKKELQRGQPETALSKALMTHWNSWWSEKDARKFVLEELTTFPTFRYLGQQAFSH